MNTKIKILTIAIFIYIVNDFFLASCKTATSYLAFDYFFRLVVLWLVATALWKQKITLRELRFISIDRKILLLESVKLIVIGYLVAEFLEPIFPLKGFVHFPSYENNFQKLLDLSLGLALVALSEEIIFRGILLFSLSSNRIFISSIAFGAIHWGMGLGSVVSGAIIGALFAHTTLKTNSLYPALIAHFFINFILFSEILK